MRNNQTAASQTYDARTFVLLDAKWNPQGAHLSMTSPQEKWLLLLVLSLFFFHLKQMLNHMFVMNSR